MNPMAFDENLVGDQYTEIPRKFGGGTFKNKKQN